MIGSERDALLNHVAADDTISRRGGPLAMLGLLLAVWVTGRAVLWESPFPTEGLIAQAEELLADNEPMPAMQEGFGALGAAISGDPGALASSAARPFAHEAPRDGALSIAGASPNGLFSSMATGDFPKSLARARVALGHQALWRTAVSSDWRGASWNAGRGNFTSAFTDHAQQPVSPTSPLLQPGMGSQDGAAQGNGTSLDRWSLDAWAFLRSGSGAAPISQGRVPVYGASQTGAILQYRAAPKSRYDPRVFVRAYRALIDRPESEIAAGISARPLGSVPVRIAAELRATDNRFGDDMRPAAYAITELPVFALPAGLSGEVYAGAGYVGGAADTAFVDGQASVTREVLQFGADGADTIRLSLGAGAWGGAQRDAERLDIGPTMRLDLAIGDVPARVSLDWRQRVSGDAAPFSGIAATLSTRF